MKKERFSAILSGIDNDLIEESNNYQSRKAKTLRWLLPVAALVLVGALCVGGIFLLKKPDAPALLPDKSTEPSETSEGKTDESVAATVYIDVNPSVAVDVDSHRAVYAVSAVNDDGSNLLLGADLVGMNIEDAVKNLVALSVEKGYLTPEQNALLLTVSSDDQTLANILRTKLGYSALTALDALLPEGRVVAQTLDYEERFKELNSKRAVNPGKAKYILDILALSSEYDEDDLIGMSFTKLLSIAESLGQPVGHRISTAELASAAIERFKEVYFPDAEISEEYIPADIPDAPAGIEPKIHVLLVRTESSEELRFEIQIGRDAAGVEDGNWSVDTVNLKRDGMIYQYRIDPENGKILWEKVLIGELSEEDALELAIDFCGKTKESLLASEVVDAGDQHFFLIYLLFENGDQYDARNVIVDKELYTAVQSWHAGVGVYEAYLRQILNDDLNKSRPGKTVGEIMTWLLDRDHRRYSCSVDGEWYHCIVDVRNDAVLSSEITENKTPSEAFEELIKTYKDAPEAPYDEFCEPTE